MEIFFVYGLVLVFFICLPILVVALLANHPYTEAPAPAQKNRSSAVQLRSSQGEAGIAYGALAILLLGLCLLAFMRERRTALQT